MNSLLLDRLLHDAGVEKFDQISISETASLTAPVLSIYLLKCIDDLQTSLKVDGFGKLAFRELEKVVLKNIMFEDIKFLNHQIYLKGKIINKFRSISSAVFMKYSEEDDFEQAINNCKPNAYFRLYSFTYKPFRLVIAPMDNTVGLKHE